MEDQGGKFSASDRANADVTQGLFALHEKDEFPVFLRMRQQCIASLLRKRLKIAHRARIGCHHTQNLAAGHVGQRFFRL